jgi:hypothetical protein
MFDIDRVEYTAARTAQRHMEAEVHRRLTRPDQHLVDQPESTQPTNCGLLAALWRLAWSRLGWARARSRT